jgi:arylsulfatase A-like enzyme
MNGAHRGLKTLTAILILSAAVVLSCSGGESRADIEVLILDLISGLDRASVEDSDFRGKYLSLRGYPRLYRDPWSHSSPRIVKIGFEIDAKKKFQNMKRAVHMGARRSSSCRISLPLGDLELRNCFFTFSLAAYRTGKEAERKISIELTGGGKRIPLYSSEAEGGAIPEKKWLDITVAIPDADLERPAVTLDFTSNSKSAEHIFIANPRIFRREKKAADTPNIVFICIDSLRTDAVNAITDRYRLTPHIDSLARDSLIFTNHFIVANWTRPSTITMLASCYASSTGVNLYYPPVHDEEKEFFYRESGVTPLSTVLKRYGYITRSIGNNSFIIDYTGIGVDLDFEDLSEYETQWEDTMDLTDEVIAWLRANRHKKFFLSITYNAPHNGYIPPAKYLNPLRKRFRNMHPWFRAYLGEVAYTDDYLGRVLAELRRLELYDNAIIVVTADHAEIFNRAHEMSPYTDKKSIYTHGQTQFDEELRVPLIIKPPASSEMRAATISAQARSIDIVPTILDLMEYRIPGSFQGTSLLPLVRGEEERERVVYSEGRMMYSVRSSGYKYAERFYGFGIRPSHWGGDRVTEYRELYSLKDDPDELRNIYHRRPGIAKKMKNLLRRVRFQQPENVITAPFGSLRGRIRVIEGFFYDMTTGSNAALEKISRKEYRFTLPKGGSLVYQTIPACARVTITIPRNEQLLCGRYALPLASRTPDGAYTVDPSENLLGGKPEEQILSLIGSGAIYWHLPRKSGIREVRKDKYLSKDINRLLRDWGYIQGKEKKSN